MRHLNDFVVYMVFFDLFIIHCVNFSSLERFSCQEKVVEFYRCCEFVKTLVCMEGASYLFKGYIARIFLIHIAKE